MAEGYADKVGSFLREAMDATVGEAKALQPEPIGTRKRGTRELNMLWDAIMSLPKPELRVIIESMAERAGHADDEAQPCELCQFLASMTSKDSS